MWPRISIGRSSERGNAHHTHRVVAMPTIHTVHVTELWHGPRYAPKGGLYTGLVLKQQPRWPTVFLHQSSASNELGG